MLTVPSSLLLGQQGEIRPHVPDRSTITVDLETQDESGRDPQATADLRARVLSRLRGAEVRRESQVHGECGPVRMFDIAWKNPKDQEFVGTRRVP